MRPFVVASWVAGWPVPARLESIAGEILTTDRLSHLEVDDDTTEVLPNERHKRHAIFTDIRHYA